MEFRTKVETGQAGFQIGACEEVLLVGSCFAGEMGERFKDNGFPAIVNPFGTMYNPASVLHSLEKMSNEELEMRNDGAGLSSFKTVFLTFGTNHVYRLKETGEIVDNCQKRPAALFQEEELSVDQCADYLRQSITLLRQVNPDVRIVLTVSPIRYRKYGYHGSQLSKATLLLAVNTVISGFAADDVAYFPAYEIVNDELRDYRFYASDMLHPSDQTVEYIWERLVDTYFSPEAKVFLKEWEPLKHALAHKPFNPNSEEYQTFMDKTLLKVEEIRKKYTTFAV